jgi:hypothetical protein
MTDHSELLRQFVLWGKITGAVITFSTLAAFLYRRLMKPVVEKVIYIGATIKKLDTNCIPTIQTSLNNQDGVLEELKAGHKSLACKIESFEVRQSNVEQKVNATHEALLNHLENTSRERPKRSKR